MHHLTEPATIQAIAQAGAVATSFSAIFALGCRALWRNARARDAR